MASVTGDDRGEERQGAVVFDLRLSRRTFLGSAGTAMLVVPEAASAQTPPRFVRQPDGSVVLAHQGLRWRIDPKWFQFDGSPAASPLSLNGAAEVRVSDSLFAGTNIAAEFSIRLVQEGGGWTLVWRFGNGGGEKRIALDTWFAGGPVGPVRFRPNNDIASDAIKVEARLSGVLRWPMAVDFSTGSAGNSDFEYRLGTTRGRVGLLRLRPYETAASNPVYDRPQLTNGVRQLLPDGMGLDAFKMRVELDKMTVRSPPVAWSLGEIDGISLQLTHKIPSVIVEVAWRGAAAGFVSACRFRSLAKRTRLIVGKSGWPRSLYLGEGAEYIEFHGRDFDGHGLVGALDDQGSMLQAQRFAATVRGGGARLIPRFRNSKILSFDIQLLTLHVPGKDTARYDVDFRTGITGLDRSAILWPKAEKGVPAILTIGHYADSGEPNHLYIGPNTESRLKVELNRPELDAIEDRSPILRARRHGDALDLGFQFHDHRIEADDAGTRIVAGVAGQRAVRFHPQHLLEEAFEAPAEQSLALVLAGPFIGLLGFAAGPPAEVKIRKLGSTASYGEDGIETRLARTRAAGPSRIAFEKGVGPGVFDLTVQNLTDWEGLKLNVTPRVDEAQKPLDDQIAFLKIVEKTDRRAAMKLVNDQFRPPLGNETALELVTGLIFSPSSGARFRVPRGELGTSALWTAELELVPVDRAGQALDQVRAIWADGLETGKLIGSNCVNDDLADAPPFIASLTGRDRAEIVLQSSTLGLPALRALDASGQDTPKSQVRLPKGIFDYLDSEALPHPKDPTGPKFRQEGVMSPAPFGKFGARLTGFGATLDAEWTAEPVAPWMRPVPNAAKPEFFNRAFSVERYVHRTSLGSDMFAEVVYKGFLFPYGFRVALVKITEREPHVVAGHGAMMPLIQRYFIVPKPIAKAMPGLYQPFNGYEIPVREARLLWERSPELDKEGMKPPGELEAYLKPEPTAQTDQCAKPVRGPVGQIFWPKLKQTGALLDFEFEADGTGTRRAVPMMFLDNAAVHDPKTVRAVIAYYNQGADRRLRTEKHFGGRTIYAAPKESGDTSFETESILLKVRSRMIETAVPPTSPPSPTPPADPDLAQFQMDAFMEGADEPPFYPIMEEARIKVPPLDRLLGEPQGFKTVGYNSHYIRNGFDPRANPSTIFLNFLTPDGVMQLGGRGEISGGVSQTPTPIAGISRDNAIVGAPARPLAKAAPVPAPLIAAAPSPADQRAAAMPPEGADDRTPWNLAGVVGNRFDPADFFQLPKLLGVIDIGKAVLPGLMAAQPRLRESYDYAVGKGAEAEETVVKAFRAAAATAATALKDALDHAEIAVRNYLKDEGGVPDRGDDYSNLKRFYPDLTSQLQGLSKLFEKAAAAGSIGDIIDQAKAISESWRRLKGAVDAIIANPTPEPIRKIVSQMRAFVDTLQGGLGSALKLAIAAELKKLIDAQIVSLREAILDELKFDANGRIVETSLFEAFFGPLPPFVPAEAPTRDYLTKRINELIDDTENLPIGLTSAPLAYAVTMPLLHIVAAGRRFAQDIGDIEASLIGQMAELAFGTLKLVAEGIASLHGLATVAQSAAVDACAAGAEPVVKMLTLALEGLPGPTDIDAALDGLRHQLVVLDLPGLGNSPEVDAVRQRNAGLRVAVQTLAGQITGLVSVRDALPKLDADRTAWCKAPGRIPAAIADLWRWRADTLRALRDCARQAGDVGEAVSHLADAQAGQAKAALATTRRYVANLAVAFTLAKLADQADVARSKLAARLQALPAPVAARLTALMTDVHRAGRELNVIFATMPDADLIELVGQAANAAAIEQHLLAFATDYSSLPGQILARVQALSRELASKFAKPLIDLHITVQTVGGNAVKAIRSQGDIVAMLTGPLLDRLDKACGYIQWDIDLLGQLSTDPAKAAVLLDRWRTEQPGLVHVARTLFEVFNAIARGQIGALFDLGAARRAVEEAVRQLVPSRVTLTYDWNTDLEPFPSGDPIFKPEPGTKPRWPDAKDLKISTKIEVDLLDPQKGRSVEVVGLLQPFSLKLLGSSLDFVTIYFTETEFRSKGKGNPNFRTNVADVKIGDKLKFLNELQNFMQSKNGFTVAPSLSPPGVEIGYSIGTPKITFGGVTFLNVAFGVSVLLPFDGSQALFRFSFASRAQPFGIIIAPYYYGGGFVALIANARGIVAFEISLEFGAATDISFGPLTGRGRVSTGLYMIDDQRGRRFEGFVHAVGEGQIACFGISVNIAVTVRPKGSSMQGTAQYSYSFRVGITELSYSFTAQYEFQGGLGKAALAPAAAVLKASPFPEEPPPPLLPAFELKYRDKERDWAAYRSHFVSDWPA